MELVTADIDRGKLIVADDDALWIVGLVEATAYHQAGLGAGASDQFDDDLVAKKGPAAPVSRDEREEPVLDPVPFGGTGGGCRSIRVSPVSSAKR